VLHVQCQSGNSEKNVQELLYPFEIITPFEKTRWFKLCILGLCILGGIVFQYIINTRKQRRLNLLAKLRGEEQGKIRMRTAEDFHDEVGNKLTRINVLVNVLRNKLGKLPPDTERLLGQIEENTGQLYSGTRDILWSLQPANDNLYEILHRIRDFGIELFQDTDIDFEFAGTDDKWRKYSLPLDVSRNLIMIFKEALNNCLKYAKASHVKLDVHFKGRDVLQMVLTDNGIGFDVRTIKRGNGINNMNVRASRFNARLYIDSRMGKGSIINLTFKIPSKRG
jgi:signal transduction histidine kinase